MTFDWLIYYMLLVYQNGQNKKLRCLEDILLIKDNVKFNRGSYS